MCTEISVKNKHALFAQVLSKIPEPEIFMPIPYAIYSNNWKSIIEHE